MSCFDIVASSSGALFCVVRADLLSIVSIKRSNCVTISVQKFEPTARGCLNKRHTQQINKCSVMYLLRISVARGFKGNVSTGDVNALICTHKLIQGYYCHETDYLRHSFIPHLLKTRILIFRLFYYFKTSKLSVKNDDKIYINTEKAHLIQNSKKVAHKY